MKSKLLIYCFVLLTYTACYNKGFAHSDPEIDSLIQQLDDSHDSIKVDIFNQLSRIYWQRSFDSSLLYATHALNISNRLNDRSRIATSLNMTGNAYYLLSNYSQGLDHYLKALKIWEENGDSASIAKSYNNIGAVHVRLKNYTEALDFFNRALNIYTGLGENEVVYTLTNNIGAVYSEQGNYEKAYEYLLKAYDIAINLNDEYRIIIALNNLGEITGKMKQYELSLKYLKEARERSESSGNINMLATICSTIGNIYLENGNLDKAFNLFKEALLFAEKVNSLEIKRDVYNGLFTYYNLLHNHREALNYYQLYSKTNDSILSEEQKLKTTELQLKYNAENFQKEIELLRKDNEIKKLSLTRQRFTIFSLAVIIILIVVILFFYVNRHRLKKETNELLKSKNQELEKTNLKLIESEKNLKELNTTKDKFFSIIGHDLRNPLNALLGFSELICRNSHDYTLEEIERYNRIINESAKNIHILIENLLEWSRSQSGNLEFVPIRQKLYDISAEILNVLKIQADNKDIGIQLDIPEQLEIYADKNLISTVLRNLLSNAIKFTGRGGFVTISAHKTNGFTEISIIDNGRGMSEQQVINLFKFDTGSVTQGTSEEKGTGLGLILCKEFIELHNGKIWVESKPDNGSKFTFILPDKQQ